jgi:hypothetical protein
MVLFPQDMMADGIMVSTRDQIDPELDSNNRSMDKVI